MRIIIFLLLILLPLPYAIGQTTNVSATIVDSNGDAWIGAKWSARFVGVDGSYAGPSILSNDVGCGSYCLTYSGTADSSGKISFTAVDVNKVYPSKGTWIITITPDVSGATTYTVSVPITGSSEDISSIINESIKAPQSPGFQFPKAYSDSDITTSPEYVSAYIRTSDNQLRYYSGGSWSTSFNSATLNSSNWTPAGNWTFSGTSSFTGSVNQLNQMVYSVGNVTTCSYTYNHDGSPITFTGTTSADCGFGALAYKAYTTGSNYTYHVPNASTAVMGTCWLEPDQGFVSLEGENFGNYRGSRIQSTGCTDYMVSLSNVHAGASGWHISNIDFDQNGVASGGLDVYNSYGFSISNVTFSGSSGTNGTNSPLRFSQGTSGTTTSYMGNITNVIVGGEMNGSTASYATIVSDGSGNISGSATITQAGSGFTDAADTFSFLQGKPSSSNTTWYPCTTMPTLTPTISGGVITALSVSGGSGCSNTTSYTITTVKFPQAPYGLEVNGLTDSRFYKVEVDDIGRDACIGNIGHAGENFYYSSHPTYCYVDIYASKNLKLLDTEHDSGMNLGTYWAGDTSQYIDERGSSYIWASSLGLTYPQYTRFWTSTNSWGSFIEGHCNGNGNAFTGTTWYEIITNNGSINSPSGNMDIDNFSCSSQYVAGTYNVSPNYSGINLQQPLPPVANVSPSITLKAQNDTTLGHVNAVQFQTRSGGQFFMKFQSNWTGDPTPTQGLYLKSGNTSSAVSGSYSWPSPYYAMNGQYWNGSANTFQDITCQQTFNSNTSTPTLATRACTHTSSLPQVYSYDSAIKPGATVVGSLPTASLFTGALFVVTDSTAITTAGQTCVGGSSNYAIAISNGTAWQCH